MTSATLLQLLILVLAMGASGLIGYWVACQKMLSGSTEERTKMAQTIEQLRERATQAEADKVRALIASERDRKRAAAWRPAQPHPAE